MMRPVIDFLNELDKDVEERSREGSALLRIVSTAARTNTEQIREKHAFQSPRIEDLMPTGPRWVSIQYSRPFPDVEFLQGALNAHSAKAVGERTFDLALKKQRGQ